MANVNDIMKELAEYIRMGEQIAATVDGRFVRMWDGYSATTMHHVNSFLSFYGMNGGRKTWWNALPVEETRRYSMAADMTPAESLKAMYGRHYANSVNY